MKVWQNSVIKDKDKYSFHGILNLENACYHAGQRFVSFLLFIIILQCSLWFCMGAKLGPLY